MRVPHGRNESLCVDAFAHARACRYQGSAEEGKAVASKTPVRFTWSVHAPGVNGTQDGELRCDRAVRQGVPLPREWKGKLGSRAGTPAVHDFAVKAVTRALVELGLGEGVKLDCRPAV